MDSFDLRIVETWVGKEERYNRATNRLDPSDTEGLAEVCRREEADEADFSTIVDIPRKVLETMADESKYRNEAFVSGIIYAWAN